MEWIGDVMRFLGEIIFNEEVAHQIQHMGLHAFKAFVEHVAPHIWNAFSDRIGDIFNFVIDWLTGNS